MKRAYMFCPRAATYSFPVMTTSPQTPEAHSPALPLLRILGQIFPSLPSKSTWRWVLTWPIKPSCYFSSPLPLDLVSSRCKLFVFHFLSLHPASHRFGFNNADLTWWNAQCRKVGFRTQIVDDTVAANSL